MRKSTAERKKMGPAETLVAMGVAAARTAVAVGKQAVDLSLGTLAKVGETRKAPRAAPARKRAVKTAKQRRTRTH